MGPSVPRAWLDTKQFDRELEITPENIADRAEALLAKPAHS
jgi:hypothetical protein